MQTIISFLENAAAVYGDKAAYINRDKSLSFRELLGLAKSAATAVAASENSGNPVAVFTGRHFYTPACYLGIAMAGCFYAPVDPTVPDARISQILDVVNAGTLITDADHIDKVRDLGYDGKIILMEDALMTPANEEVIESAMGSITESSPLYVLFTSGSTGKPKGVLTSHHSMLCYLDGLLDVIHMDDTDVIGNQAPLDYIAAIRDMYLPLMTGATTYMLDPSEFAMPQRLIGSLSEAGVTTLCWSATGLEIPARLGAFDEDDIPLPPLRRVVFSGSVISNPLLRKWQDAFPETVFINQYGPTEATGSCTYYVIDHSVETDEVIPVGRPFRHYQILLLDDDNNEAADGAIGEICVRGPAVALGYYDAPEQTAASFTDNPLQHHYRETIYRTGDLGRIGDDGELYFLGRKDRQFKHLGHRIEPEEIEQKAMTIDGVDDCACTYNAYAKTIFLFYTGTAASKEISLGLRAGLPSYMVPRKIKCLEEMPRLPNGKTDRKAIEALASAK